MYKRVGYHRHPIEREEMPNRCSFCDIRKPTNHLILGKDWIEFCESCGDSQMLARIDKGNLETKTVREVFDSLTEERTRV